VHWIKHIVGVCVLGSLIMSCASLGTKVRVVNPEALSALETIAIWPIAVVPLRGKFEEKFPELNDSILAQSYDARMTCELASEDAELLLAHYLDSHEMFSVISADSVMALVTLHDPSFSRFSKDDWRTYSDLINAQAIILSKLSFAGESWGTNTYVTLVLCSQHTGEVIVETKFNTMWGKSYFFPQPIENTMPDAIEGAVKALAKAMRKHRP
jgi:hypothetical protein